MSTLQTATYVAKHVYFGGENTIANVLAPTTTEIAALVLGRDNGQIEGGFSEQVDENVATLSLNNGTTATALGSRQKNMEVTGMLTVGGNDLYDFFDVQNKEGFVVVSDFGPAVEGSLVRVFPCNFGLPRRMDAADNTIQQYAVTIVTADWTDQEVEVVLPA